MKHTCLHSLWCGTCMRKYCAACAYRTGEQTMRLFCQNSHCQKYNDPLMSVEDPVTRKHPRSHWANKREREKALDQMARFTQPTVENKVSSGLQ